MTGQSCRSLDLRWQHWALTRGVDERTGGVDPATRIVVAGRYVVRERIGEGATGCVYLAHDSALGRDVALKSVEPAAIGEARALARVGHPHVVRVHEAGLEGDTGYLILELVAGPTLGRWCSAGEPSPRQILKVYRDAGRGLAAIHDAGLVHRDFKPDNVQVGDGDRAVIVDFGLAVEATRALRNGPGSPKYMSPEQLQGRRASPSSDQFAFCVALWEALAGVDPFGGSTAAARVDGYLAGPRGVVGGRVGRVLRRGLRLSPGDRWPSMLALVGALHEAEQAQRRRRPTLAAAGMAAVAVLALGVLSPWASSGYAAPGGLSAESLAHLAEHAADDGRADDAIMLLEAANRRADGTRTSSRVAASADAVGLRLYEHGEFGAAIYAHDQARHGHIASGRDDLALRSLELARVALDARAR